MLFRSVASDATRVGALHESRTRHAGSGRRARPWELVVMTVAVGAGCAPIERLYSTLPCVPHKPQTAEGGLCLLK